MTWRGRNWVIQNRMLFPFSFLVNSLALDMAEIAKQTPMEMLVVSRLDERAYCLDRPGGEGHTLL